MLIKLDKTLLETFADTNKLPIFVASAQTCLNPSSWGLQAGTDLLQYKHKHVAFNQTWAKSGPWATYGPLTDSNWPV